MDIKKKIQRNIIIHVHLCSLSLFDSKKPHRFPLLPSFDQGVGLVSRMKQRCINIDGTTYYKLFNN